MLFLKLIFTDLFSALDGCNSVWTWFPPLLFSMMMFSNSNMVLFLSKYGFGNSNLIPFGGMVMTTMFFLINMNLVGLTPLVFSMSSSLWFASSMALTMWLLLIISSFVYSPKKTLAHLAPAGAPLALTPFLVMIETISILIRPLTLTVRLIANISAGHIVLALIANCLSALNLKTFFFILLVSVFYNMFEVFVCMIQAYIFTLLLKLYSFEHASFLGGSSMRSF